MGGELSVTHMEVPAAPKHLDIDAWFLKPVQGEEHSEAKNHGGKNLLSIYFVIEDHVGDAWVQYSTVGTPKTLLAS